MNNIGNTLRYIIQKATAEATAQLAKHFFTTRGQDSWRGKLFEEVHRRVSADLKCPDLVYSGDECHDFGNAAEARRDYQFALEWFHKGAAKGHANCKNSIGVYYAIGRGVEADAREAAYWHLAGVKSGLRGRAIAANLIFAAKRLSAEPNHTDQGMARECLETAARIAKRKQAAEARALLASLPAPALPEAAMLEAA